MTFTMREGVGFEIFDISLIIDLKEIKGWLLNEKYR